MEPTGGNAILLGEDDPAVAKALAQVRRRGRQGGAMGPYTARKRWA
jgi:hypothetical protein